MLAPVSDVAIFADSVVKTYGSVTALDGVSVESDDLAVGLLGANGAGKSTFMKALLGLVRPDKGSLRVLGIDAAASGHELRRRIGYMPEHECLPRAMAARDLVVHLGELRGLPRRVAVLRASEVLFQVGLEEERSRLIGTFSTGMRQRVKLAQALVHAPELVVLDEPTNGLDPAGPRRDALARAAALARPRHPRAVLVARAGGRRAHLRRGDRAARRARRDAGPHRRARRRRRAGACMCASSATRAALRGALRARGLAAEDGGDGAWVVRCTRRRRRARRRARRAAEAGVSLRALRRASARSRTP